ncbi:MAG: alpha/beta hydrolase, partial [Actinomycetota bacterium]|nr:alpha/beta hydrolase [Actinomycetota bacterium]
PWAAALAAAGLVVMAGTSLALLSRQTSDTPNEAVDAGPAPEFTERQTQFVGAGGHNLAGTLTLPGTGDGRDVPAVLIVPGLGAIDRNATTLATGPDAGRDALVSSISGVAVSAGDPLYQDLGESLARAGVASFRYDRRGTTSSPLRPGQKLSFDDEVADARAALELLAQRQEIGNAPLAVLGHDSGGMVAMRLAAGNARVKAVVAVSTPGRPLVDVLADELGRTRGAGVADQFRAAATALTASGRAPAPETLPEVVRPIFAPGHDGYLGTIFALDPAAEAGKVSVPVLLARGGGDQNVTAADIDRLSASLRAGGQAVVAGPQADHNLSLAGAAGHEHSNTVSGPVDHRDADARAALTAWVKTHLTT